MTYINYATKTTIYATQTPIICYTDNYIMLHRQKHCKNVYFSHIACKFVKKTTTSCYAWGIVYSKEHTKFEMQ